jgi:hypothetical protein
MKRRVHDGGELLDGHAHIGRRDAEAGNIERS